MQRPLVALAFENEVACMGQFLCIWSRQSLVMMHGPLVTLAFELAVACMGQVFADFSSTESGHDAGPSSSTSLQA